VGVVASERGMAPGGRPGAAVDAALGAPVVAAQLLACLILASAHAAESPAVLCGDALLAWALIPLRCYYFRSF